MVGAPRSGPPGPDLPDQRAGLGVERGGVAGAVGRVDPAVVVADSAAEQEPSGALRRRGPAPATTVPPFSGLNARTTALGVDGEDLAVADHRRGGEPALLLLPSPMLDPPGLRRRGAEARHGPSTWRRCRPAGPIRHWCCAGGRVTATPASAGSTSIDALARRAPRCARRRSGSSSSCPCRRAVPQPPSRLTRAEGDNDTLH